MHVFRYTKTMADGWTPQLNKVIMKIITAIENLKWSHNENGAAFFKDGKGKDWYEQRNALADDKPIIVVDVATRYVHMLWTGDPTMVTMPIPMIYESVHVYQLDKVDMGQQEFFSKRWVFLNGKIVEKTD